MTNYALSLSQKAYIDRVLATANMDNWKEASSPMMANPNLIKNTEAAEDEQLIRTYQSHVGIQMWAYVCTRPDLGFSV